METYNENRNRSLPISSGVEDIKLRISPKLDIWVMIFVMMVVSRYQYGSLCKKYGSVLILLVNFSGNIFRFWNFCWGTFWCWVLFGCFIFILLLLLRTFGFLCYFVLDTFLVFGFCGAIFIYDIFLF